MKWSHWVLVVALISVFALIAIPGAAQPVQRFDDVDQSNIFFADIDWMAESGVTSGCSSNPPLFCPDDFVTREQMAAFMRRLATKRVVDAGSLNGTDGSAFIRVGQKVSDADKLDGADSSAFVKVGQKVADADKLDGKDSSAFLQAGQAVSNSDRVDGFHANQLGVRATFAATGDVDPDAWGDVLTATIVAPANGILIAGGTIDVTATVATEAVYCYLRVGGLVFTGAMYESVNTTDSPEGICSNTGATPVPAGSHDVALFINSSTGQDPLGLWAANLWVQWVPFDGTGAVPMAVAPAGSFPTDGAK